MTTEVPTPPATPDTVTLPGLGGLLERSLHFVWQRKDLVAWYACFNLLGLLALGVGLVATYIAGENEQIVLATLALALGCLAGLTIFIFSHTAMQYAVVAREPVTFQAGLRWTWEHIWVFSWLLFLMALIVTTGFFLLLVPGIIMAVYFYFVTFVMMVEGRTGISALVRSTALVYQKWWSCLGYLFAVGFLGGIMVQMAVGVLQGLVVELSAESPGLLLVVVTGVVVLVIVVLQLTVAIVTQRVLAGMYHALAAQRPDTNMKEWQGVYDTYRGLAWLPVVLVAALVALIVFTNLPV